MALQPQFGIGVALVAISIPLVARMVPRNPLYGVRIAKAFISDRHWYEINAYAGKLFLVYGLLLGVFGVLGEGRVPPPPSLGAALATAGPLVLIFPILLMIRSFARRMPNR